MRTFAFFLLLLYPVALNAQEVKLKDLDFLRGLAQTRGYTLGRPVRPMPTHDGKAVLFLRGGPRSTQLSLFEFDVATGKTRELLTPAQVLRGGEEKLSPEEKAQRERMRVSAGGFTSFQLSDDNQFILLTLSGKLYLVRRDTGAVQQLKTGAGPLLTPQLAPSGKKVAYVREHDLHVLDLATQTETRLTQGGSAATPNGLAEFVAQEEMGRFVGFWWAPDSQSLAYQHTDQRDVEIWYVGDPTEPGQKPTPFHYPRPGKTNAAVKLAVAPVAGGPSTPIAWDHDKYPYLATVRWSQRGKLSLVVQSRDQKQLALLSADSTGKTATLLAESSEYWLNLHQEAPVWLPDDAGFLWVSERLGGPSLEVRAPNGRFRRVLVTPEMGYQGLIGVDDKGMSVLYTASEDPTQAQVFRTTINSVFGEPEQLTKGQGLHSAVAARDHSVIAVTARLLEAMPRTLVQNAEGKTLGALPSVAEDPPLRVRVELRQVGGNPKFHAAIVWPADFNGRNSYPVLVDVYGGPRHQHVVANQQRWLLDQWYANQGFIVVSIDGRGTPHRGGAWEHAIYQKFGSVPLDDQVRGLQELASEFPAMDLKRVGIDGWSFGGYLAGLAVLRRPDVFHAAVAGAPVTEWHDYDTHYTERYLGVPPAADAAYREASLLTYAADLKRPLMLLHGTADDNVYFCHSLKLARALFRHGKDFELLPLSGLTHMVPDPEVMERLHSRIALFFRRHLK